jgi:HK97 family phage major capsid protein
MDFEKLMELLNQQGTLFHEFKKTNDERLSKLEAKAGGVAELDEKLAKIQAAMTENSDAVANLEKAIAAKSRPNTSNQIDAKKKLEMFAAYVTKGDPAYINAVRTDNDPDGGFAVPEDLDTVVDQVLMEDIALLSLCEVRKYSAKHSKLVTVSGAVTSNSAQFETVEDTKAGKLVKINAVYGKRVAKVPLSEEAEEDMMFDPENWVRDNVGIAMSENINQEMISGSGASESTKGFLAYPMAYTQDSTRAFGTIQKIKSGLSGGFLALNTTTGVNPVDRLKDMQIALKSVYRRNARWLMNRFTEGAIMKLKDADGKYLMEPRVTLDKPATILGYPIAIDDLMPDIAANSLSLSFGDFKRGIRAILKPGMRVIRDVYTKAPNTYLVFSKRYGLMLRDSRAIKVMEFAAD